jgi:hypothetical protein
MATFGKILQTVCGWVQVLADTGSQGQPSHIVGRMLGVGVGVAGESIVQPTGASRAACAFCGPGVTLMRCLTTCRTK